MEPGLIITVWRNHGRPRHNKMSKTLLPTALDIAISPKPFLTTSKLDIASGTLTPAAKNVRPITVSGILNVKPEKCF